MFELLDIVEEVSVLDSWISMNDSLVYDHTTTRLISTTPHLDIDRANET